jgi:large subunit ribosomal protein L29
MANKNAEEVRALTDQQILDQIEQAHHDLFNLRFRMATRQQNNNQEIRKTRRRIARLRTIQTERRLGLHAQRA